jgi:hypothetical protein
MQGSLGIPVIKSPASHGTSASKGPANLATPATKNPGNLGTRASRADRSTRHRTAATPAAVATPTERRAARAPTGLPARIARNQG